MFFSSFLSFFQPINSLVLKRYHEETHLVDILTYGLSDVILITGQIRSDFANLRVGNIVDLAEIKSRVKAHHIEYDDRSFR